MPQFIVEDGSILVNANSLVSIAEASEYLFFDPFRKTDWTNIEDEEKEKYLVFATRFLTQSYRFQGQRTDKEQPLPFPRKYLINPDTGFYFPDDIIPAAIKHAVVEIALWFYERQTAEYSSTDDVLLVRTEDVEVSFDPKANYLNLPSVIRLLLAGIGEYLGGEVSSWKIRKA